MDAMMLNIEKLKIQKRYAEAGAAAFAANQCCAYGVHYGMSGPAYRLAEREFKAGFEAAIREVDVAAHAAAIKAAIWWGDDEENPIIAPDVTLDRLWKVLEDGFSLTWAEYADGNGGNWVLSTLGPDMGREWAEGVDWSMARNSLPSLLDAAFTRGGDNVA